jgi:hypothetical protein
MEAKLRVDPDSAFAENDFVVDSTVYTGGTIGGSCRILCNEIGSKIFRLNAEAGHGDWFFPYVWTTEGGVGTCEIPAGQPDGTIVATGAMNGCTLQVNRSHDDLFFYHDTNSVSMSGKLAPGDVVALVEPAQYAGVEDMGYSLARDHSRGSSTSGAIFEHHMVTVRAGGLWKI